MKIENIIAVLFVLFPAFEGTEFLFDGHENGDLYFTSKDGDLCITLDTTHWVSAYIFKSLEEGITINGIDDRGKQALKEAMGS